MTANLHITVKQAAALMNVSVRSVYDAKRLRASGRSDLVAKVMSGDLSLNRALILAGLREPTKRKGLIAAWGQASTEERQAFHDWLAMNGGAS